MALNSTQWNGLEFSAIFSRQLLYLPAACCRHPNTKTLWGWKYQPRNCLWLNFFLRLRNFLRDCLTICNEGTTFIRTLLFLIIIWAITPVFFSDKPMNIWVKQIWLVALTFLQFSAVVKEKIPAHCFDWMGRSGAHWTWSF